MNPSVVVFDRDGNLASLQRSVLRQMGLSNNGLVSDEKSLLKDLVIGRDLVLLNWNADWDGLIDLVKTIRHKTTSPDPFVGIVAMSSSLNSSHARAALDAGVNSLLAVPFAAGDVQTHVRHVLSKAWRFIDAPNYFGPDRRHRDAPLEADERRSAQCRFLEGQDLLEERQRMRATTLKAFDMKVAHSL